MQPSVELRTYLHLEKLMLQLDEVDEPSGDVLRDLMEPFWYQLSNEEQEHVRNRGDFAAVLTVHGLDSAPTREESAPEGGTRRVLLSEAA